MRPAAHRVRVRPILSTTPADLVRATRLVERVGLRVEPVVGDVLVPIADAWTRPWARIEERIVKQLGLAVNTIHTNDHPLPPWTERCTRLD
jgi:hypothetical protein